MRIQPSYLVRLAAMHMTEPPSRSRIDRESRYRVVKNSKPMSVQQKTASVMGIDCRYSAFGFRRKSAIPHQADATSKMRRRDANSRAPAAVKHKALGIGPASPLRHRVS